MDSKKPTNSAEPNMNFARTLLGQDNTVMIDLHGLSAAQAQKRVTHYMNEANVWGWNKIRFVTGRGNHVNARGERGTLYKSFNEWLQAVPDNVARINQFDGYYEVDIKNDIPLRNPFLALMTEAVQESLKDNIEDIKAGAVKGNTNKMVALALCYDKGIGVQQSYHKATDLYMRLADQKDAAAQYEMGCRYFIGKGIKQNDVLALKFLTLSADQNYMLAEFLLGEIYSKGYDSFTINHPRANEYYFKAASKGHPESARKLGCAYSLGLGAKEDYAQAVYWWEKASKAGDSVAAFNMVFAYQNGRGVAKNPKKALEYLTLSAERNDPDGQCILGECYYFGNEHVKQNENEGLKWLQRAADNACANAQFILFIHYKKLNDSKKSKQYLVNAAENDHIEAQYLIALSTRDKSNKNPSDENLKEVKYSPNSQTKIAGDLFDFKTEFQDEMMQRLLNRSLNDILQIQRKSIKYMIIDLLLCGDSTRKQMQKGVELLDKLADEKCTESLCRLGAVYVLGNVKSVDKNINKGLEYWLRGAALGDSDCLCSLGYFWQTGAGDKVDYKKAFKYFSDAAARDNANANNQMGTFYCNERYGIKNDLKLAAKYFERAMELDKPTERNKKRKKFNSALNTFKHAAQNLAALYLQGGEGFPKDEIKGVELLKLSAADGMSDAAVLLATYYKEKDQMMECMYYVNIAAELGHAGATAMLKKMPADIKAANDQIKRQVSAELAEEMSANKEQILTLLQRLSSCLNESIEWKITSGNDAWAYISNSLHGKFKQIDGLKDKIKKSKNGPYLILLKNIYQCNLDEIARLFEKVNATTPLTTKFPIANNSASLLAQNTFLTNGSAASADQKRGAPVARIDQPSAVAANIAAADHNKNDLTNAQSLNSSEKKPSTCNIM